MSDADQFHEILGVPVFRVGIWNDAEYSADDLDEMVRASREIAYDIPITLGHVTEPGSPAVGWLTRLRRVGDQLLADLTALPTTVFNAIKRRAYGSVSLEIFWNLRRNGRVFPRAVKALALLGGEVPGVDLPPLREFVPLSAMQYARVACHSFDFETLPAAPTWQECGDVLAELAHERATEKRMPFAAAFREVAAEHPAVTRAYSEKQD